MVRFIRGPNNYKYTAILEDGKRVNFGDKRYQQFHDRIGVYKHMDHNDPVRRANYRKRHGAIRLKDGTRAIDHKYSAAWFSYYYLW